MVDESRANETADDDVSGHALIDPHPKAHDDSEDDDVAGHVHSRPDFSSGALGGDDSLQS